MVHHIHLICWYLALQPFHFWIRHWVDKNMSMDYLSRLPHIANLGEKKDNVMERPPRLLRLSLLLCRGTLVPESAPHGLLLRVAAALSLLLTTALSVEDCIACVCRWSRVHTWSTMDSCLGVEGVEMFDVTLTFICWLLRKLETIDWLGCWSLRSESSILYMCPLCHALSNVLFILKNNLLRFLWMSSDMWRVLSVVVLPFVKLAWWIAMRPIDLLRFLRREVSIISNNFPTGQRALMG